MQSVVTGQVPITLEGKITSGGTQLKTGGIKHNNSNKSYTLAKIKKMWEQRTYVTKYISYAKRVAAEPDERTRNYGTTALVIAPPYWYVIPPRISYLYSYILLQTNM